MGIIVGEADPGAAVVEEDGDEAGEMWRVRPGIKILRLQDRERKQIRGPERIIIGEIRERGRWREVVSQDKRGYWGEPYSAYCVGSPSGSASNEK